MSILDPRLWLALLLALAAAFAGGFFKGASHGKSLVRAEWNAAKVAASNEARAMENRRQSAVDAAARVAAAREVRMRADADRAAGERDGLRDDLRAVRLHASQSIAASNAAVATIGELFEHCSSEYLRVAQEADRATSEAIELRMAWPK